MTIKQSESMYLKHLGIGSIAFAGSNTTRVFTEYPADDHLVDSEGARPIAENKLKYS